MKVYKILHVPTGWYYKPSKHRHKANLSSKGKLYHKKPSLKWLKGGYYHPEDFKQYNENNPVRYPKPGEFKIVEFEITEIK